MTYTVNNNPISAGIILAAITEGNDAPKFSAAIMVLGLGEIIFPHFPPPIMAINNLLFRQIEPASGNESNREQ